MHLNQLRYFIEIAKTNSMRLAAENLFISQPALSSAIRQLEKELGFTLFIRNNNGVTLTSEGQQALLIADEIVNLAQQFNTIKPQVQSTAPNSSIDCHLRFCTVPSQSRFTLPDVLAQFSVDYPNISFSILEQTTEHILETVNKGDSDIGLISIYQSNLDLLTSYPDLVPTAFFKEQAYILVNSNSSLFHRKSISLNNLLDYPVALLINNDTDFFGSDEPTEMFRQVFGFTLSKKLKIVFQSSNLNLVEDYVINHDCFTVCSPSTYSQKEILSKQLKTIPIKDTFRYFYSIYRSDTPYTEIIEHFNTMLKKYYAYNKKQI